MLSNYISCLPVSDFQQQSDSFFNQKMCTSIVILLTHAPIKRLRRTLIEHPNFTLEVTQWPIHNHIFLLLLKSFQHVIIKLFAEFFSFNLQPRSPCIKTALSMQPLLVKSRNEVLLEASRCKKKKSLFPPLHSTFLMTV